MRLTERARNFLLETVPPQALGVFRAAVGVAALGKAPELARQLPGTEGFESGSFAWLGVLPHGLWPLVLGTWIVAAMCLTVGYRSRLAAGAVATLAAFVISFAGLYSNHLYLLATFATLLILADAGAAFSLDSRRVPAREAKRVSAWPVRLLQIQVSLVYLYAALSKVNQDFLPGNVLFYRADSALLLPNLDRVAFFPVFAGMSIAAILTELFIAGALWVGRLRPAAIALGLMLHSAMLVVISSSPGLALKLMVFELLMLSSYLLFLNVEVGSRVVVWDEGCAFCSKWVKWFGRLDWLRAFRFVGLGSIEGHGAGGPIRERALEALQLVEPHGHRHEGFEAVRRIAAALPLTFLFAPLLGIKPIRLVGDRAYRRVAARRSCPRPLQAGHRPGDPVGQEESPRDEHLHQPQV